MAWSQTSRPTILSWTCESCTAASPAAVSFSPFVGVVKQIAGLEVFSRSLCRSINSATISQLFLAFCNEVFPAASFACRGNSQVSGFLWEMVFCVYGINDQVLGEGISNPGGGIRVYFGNFSGIMDFCSRGLA